MYYIRDKIFVYKVNDAKYLDIHRNCPDCKDISATLYYTLKISLCVVGIPIMTVGLISGYLSRIFSAIDSICARYINKL